MRAMILTGIALFGFARPAVAQNSQCSNAPTEVQDACYTAFDMFHYVTPQFGVALTGGNVILSQGGSLGGIPRFSIAARVNVVPGNLPTIQAPSQAGPAIRTTSNPYPTKNTYIGFPMAEASFGLFRGLDVGGTSVGGVDALVSATVLPTVTVAGISAAPDGPVKIGYGVRVGLLEETVLSPGLSIELMVRGLPVTDLLTAVGSDSMRVSDYTLKATSWRVAAGKSFAAFSLAGGLGQDIYDASTLIEGIVNAPVIGRMTTGPLVAATKITRMNVFGNFALNLLVAKLVAEGGIVSGADIPTANVFDVAANVTRYYGSVGFRVGY